MQVIRYNTAYVDQAWQLLLQRMEIEKLKG